jgi:hypothetical protein
MKRRTIAEILPIRFLGQYLQIRRFLAIVFVVFWVWLGVGMASLSPS